MWDMDTSTFAHAQNSKIFRGASPLREFQLKHAYVLSNLSLNFELHCSLKRKFSQIQQSKIANANKNFK